VIAVRNELRPNI